MDNRPIGVFDSGLGGLTAERELEKLLPNESIIYFGDTGRVPYGTKSPETVTAYAKQAVAFLKSKNVKAILAACGTVSSVGNSAGENAGLPYFNVLASTVKATAESSRRKMKRIGVIATPATIRSGEYKKLLLEIDSELSIFELATPLFVPMVEEGIVSPDDELLTAVVERSLVPLIHENIDTLILGCTHYPIIAKTISDVIGKDVRLINSGEEAAKALATHLKENSMQHDESKNERCFYVSDVTENFSKIAGIFLGHSVDGQKINIEEY